MNTVFFAILSGVYRRCFEEVRAFVRMLAGGRRPFEHGLWKVREGGYALVRSEHSFML